ncbi:DUF2868 domain-containing protein [Aquabacterium sp.]|uniref:DUF2868 domain-containing protein n=1 Tax=Aquabacterium sp. TaxID=1872578 RepID=UPI002D06928B|nr:DUF2868 domain-containing protein [Aquabacterium sp.]HSW03823.1 DUF2868 domain-containing protein [Aquabacterium sp.]
MTEDEARRVVLLQSRESAGPTPLWTDDDRAWAHRAARQDGAADAPFERYVVERARHAMQRLLPRDAQARRWLQPQGRHAVWLALAVLLAFIGGMLVDRIGAAHHIDLLAPPVWAVVAWNLAVYLALLVPGSHRFVRRPLAGMMKGPRLGGEAALALGSVWARCAAPLTGARWALGLHLAAAALAAGLITGLYLRGLVQDYRAGWQSTFLDAPAVQAVLNLLLAPAAAVSGIAVPEAAPLRVMQGVAPQGNAAPWIHLYAVTLLLMVVLPRVALTGWAAWRVGRLRRHFPLPLDGPYYDKLRLQQRGGRIVAEVRPHAAAVSAQAALGLRALLATVWGDAVDLRITEPVPHGHEEEAATAPPADATLRIALFELGATPESDAHGRLLDALAGPTPRLAVVDEAAFKRRFASQPERLQQRRAAWQGLVRTHGVGLVCVDLEGDVGLAAADLKAALA